MPVTNLFLTRRNRAFVHHSSRIFFTSMVDKCDMDRPAKTTFDVLIKTSLNDINQFAKLRLAQNKEVFNLFKCKLVNAPPI